MSDKLSWVSVQLGAVRLSGSPPSRVLPANRLRSKPAPTGAPHGVGLPPCRPSWPEQGGGGGAPVTVWVKTFIPSRCSKLACREIPSCTARLASTTGEEGQEAVSEEENCCWTSISSVVCRRICCCGAGSDGARGGCPLGSPPGVSSTLAGTVELSMDGCCAMATPPGGTPGACCSSCTSAMALGRAWGLPSRQRAMMSHTSSGQSSGTLHPGRGGWQRTEREVEEG